jgi:putative nucleotidyltransferase with HDIG domain
MTSSAIKATLLALEAKQEALFCHSLRTASIAETIARKVYQGDSTAIEDATSAALLHDVGKLRVCDSILGKAGTLDAREWEIIREHPSQGADFLKKIPELSRFALFAEQHHEAADGSGYPSGLKCEDIHITSRIINIADRFSALTETRPYRKAHTDPIKVVGMLTKDIHLFFGEVLGIQIVQSLLALHATPLRPLTYSSPSDNYPANTHCTIGGFA